MITRGFCRHERFLDVVVYVLKVTFRGPDYVKARIEWWNHGANLGIKQTIKVSRVELSKWHPAETQTPPSK